VNACVADWFIEMDKRWAAPDFAPHFNFANTPKMSEASLPVVAYRSKDNALASKSTLLWHTHQVFPHVHFQCPVLAPRDPKQGAPTPRRIL
jgi:hypothetical protein